MRPQLEDKPDFGREARLLAEWIEARVRAEPARILAQAEIEHALQDWARRIVHHAMQENPWKKLMEEHLRHCPGAPLIVEKTR